MIKEKGAAVFRGVFTDWVAVLRAGVDANIAEPDPNVRIYTGENGNARFFVDYCDWVRTPEYKDFIFHFDAATPGAA